MPSILSSWKEIADYMGKSVRTVQRWEKDSQFPVRRPRRGKGAMIVYAEEIDAWVHSRATVPDTAPADQSEVERLRNLVAALQAANQQLRQERQTTQATAAIYKSDHSVHNPLPDIVLLARSNRLRTAELLRRGAEVQDYWRNLHHLLAYKEDGKPLLIRMLDLIQ